MTGRPVDVPMRLRLCGVAVAVLLSGCAVENRLLMPRTPLRGQSESQVKIDKTECKAIAEQAGIDALNRHRGANVALGLAGLGTVEDQAGTENKAYKACMTERGYR